MIGQVLGGRYEILDRVGGGGMAIVYKANDILLNRKVAVKVLRQQYVHDEEFIHRFRREAQSAASLSHPNVVSIYDVGHTEDIHYIVMEYVEGKTLNEMIKEKAPLQVEQAVHIAAQICDALEHAHHNHIVHRDIKPHNILIGKNGRIKVTDFGIARATAASSITQTGSVVGSVHYFSPEHAKGTAAGAKSDLYSLGVVIYQMLTGRLPFSGESPVSVALKHLRENPVDPRKVNPLIPQSVENIMLRALRKNPEDRYASAQEMQNDLETCLLPQRRNEPKLAIPDPDAEDEDRTRVIPAIRAGSYPAYDEEDEEDRKGNRWVKPLLWVLIPLIILIGAWYGFKSFLNSVSVQDVVVPDVTNKPLSQAEAMLTARGLKSEPDYVVNATVPKDIVIKQSNTVSKVKAGSTIKLTVSKGAELIKMPDYSGRPFTDVKNELIGMGIKDTQISSDEAFSDQPAGNVVQQQPRSGTDIDPTKDQLKFTVSKGKETIAMPDLTGMTLIEAKAALAKLKLNLAPDPDGVIQQPNFSQPKGKVFDQWPYTAGMEVQPGQNNIKVYVSTGMPTDAGVFTYNLEAIAPAQEGKTSTVRIVVSDAKADNVEYTTQKINKPTVISVPVVVTPAKNANIQIIRDNMNLMTVIVTYKDYLEQTSKPKTSPAPSVSASASATPPPGPSQSPSQKPSPTPSAGTGGR